MSKKTQITHVSSPVLLMLQVVEKGVAHYEVLK